MTISRTGSPEAKCCRLLSGTWKRLVRFSTLPGFHNLEVNGSNPFAATDFPLHGLIAAQRDAAQAGIPRRTEGPLK